MVVQICDIANLYNHLPCRWLAMPKPTHFFESQKKKLKEERNRNERCHDCSLQICRPKLKAIIAANAACVHQSLSQAMRTGASNRHETSGYVRFPTVCFRLFVRVCHLRDTKNVIVTAEELFSHKVFSHACNYR